MLAWSGALLDYVDATYVSGTYRSTQRPAIPGESQPVIQLRKILPIFPPQLWNVHDATVLTMRIGQITC